MVDGQKKVHFAIAYNLLERLKEPAGRNVQYRTCQNPTFLLEPKKFTTLKLFYCQSFKNL